MRELLFRRAYLFLALLLVKVGQPPCRNRYIQRCHLASAAWIPCYTKGTQGSAEMSIRSGIDGGRRDLLSALSLLDGMGVKTKPARLFRSRN
ncbi:hypothetical protein EV714DRAFT_249265 [Schizophyllum commune]